MTKQLGRTLQKKNKLKSRQPTSTACISLNDCASIWILFMEDFFLLITKDFDTI
jgi:hypothetical protein